MSQSDMESIFTKNNQWNIVVIGKYYVNSQNYQNLMLLSSSNTKRTLMQLFLFSERTGFNMYTEYTQPQLTFLALVPCMVQSLRTMLVQSLRHVQ